MFNKLPVDMINTILNMSSLETMINVSKTSKEMKAIIDSDNSLPVKKLFNKKYGSLEYYFILRKTNTNSKILELLQRHNLLVTELSKYYETSNDYSSLDYYNFIFTFILCKVNSFNLYKVAISCIMNLLKKDKFTEKFKEFLINKLVSYHYQMNRKILNIESSSMYTDYWVEFCMKSFGDSEDDFIKEINKLTNELVDFTKHHFENTNYTSNSLKQILVDIIKKEFTGDNAYRRI